MDEDYPPILAAPCEHQCRRRRDLHTPTLEHVALVQHAGHHADVPVLTRDEIAHVGAHLGDGAAQLPEILVELGPAA
jgi:hypothetical protein